MDVRDSALASVRSTFQDAAQINRAITGETGAAIRKLAAIRLASTFAVTGISCVLTLGGTAVEVAAAARLSSAYGFAGAALKDWGDAEHAKGIVTETGEERLKNAAAKNGAGEHRSAVISEAVKQAGEQAVDRRAEAGVSASIKWALSYLPGIRAAQIKVNRYAAELAKDIQQRERKIAERRFEKATGEKSAQLAGARNAIRTVKAARAVKFSISLIFAALDLKEALSEYIETVESTR